MLLIAGLETIPAFGQGDFPVLEFIQPTNGSVFSTQDEIPIVLRAYAPSDVFLSAEVLANHFQKVGTASYCCAGCPCAHPLEGEETILQIPVPWENRLPPSRLWQGWTSQQAGHYQLTAQATGENGTKVDAAPVNITVIDRTLRIQLAVDGSVLLVIQQGSMTRGSYDLEASPDLKTWARLGPFQPGNVAAFYWDDPPTNERPIRFYRSVWIPPRVP